MAQSVLIALAACCCATPAAAVPIEAVSKNIVATAQATADLSTLVKAVVAGGLAETLAGNGSFTVFAPTDLAFDQLPNGVLASLLDPKNVKQLQAVLLYHVANGYIPSTDFGPRQEVTTLNDAQVTVVSNRTAPAPYGATQVFVNQAIVQVPNVDCTNGIVHIINEVLIPPALLLELEALGGTKTKAAADPAVVSPGAPMNIVETAVGTRDLSILVKLVTAAKLVDTLTGNTSFTVFAPTDLAFDKIPANTLAKLLLPENIKQLQAILLYHVVSGSLPSTDFGPRQQVTTVNGAQVTIVSNRTAPPPYGVAEVFVNQALVQKADIRCTNGIVHITYSVLLPPSWKN